MEKRKVMEENDKLRLENGELKWQLSQMNAQMNAGNRTQKNVDVDEDYDVRVGLNLLLIFGGC